MILFDMWVSPVLYLWCFQPLIVNLSPLAMGLFFLVTFCSPQAPLAHRCENSCSGELNRSCVNSWGRNKFLSGDFVHCSHVVCSVVLSRNLTPCSWHNTQRKWMMGGFWKALSTLWRQREDNCLNLLLSHQQPLSMVGQNQHGLK